MHNIAVTVLMPCYNAADYIAEAVRSVLAQTFTRFELLIVDDGSTDSSAASIESFDDPRIVLLKQQQKGIAAALNYGLQYARAPYIARFDADDVCLPERLEIQYRFMMRHPDIIVSGTAADYVDSTGQYIFTHFPPAESSEQIQALSFDTCPFIHASVMYKKEPIKSFGYNVHAHSFEDHLLWQQLKPQGAMHNLRDRLIKVRLNPGSLTMDERKRPAAFHRVKMRALQSGDIAASDGDQLLALIKQQNDAGVKRGAYHSLLAKKFLWNNYNPARARAHIKTAIQLNDFDMNDYALLLLSYMPKPVVTNLYSLLTSAR